jgi:hypothetical protein
MGTSRGDDGRMIVVLILGQVLGWLFTMGSV